MKPLKHFFTALGILTFAVLIAVLYDILTDGDKRMWKEARYDGFRVR